MASRTARKGTSRYKIRNWKQYEAGLIQRGSISFWINDDAIDQWNPEAKDKTRGRQEEYSDLAIQICLTFRLLYRQALRQTEGFINSLLKLMDLDLICPDHTTLSRRSQTLKELQEQLKKVQKKESIHILIDSTGLKIYGAGEWEEPKHGKGRRKGWMKLHLAIDENSKEIEASTLTDHLTSDASQVKPLLDNVDAEIGDVKADGAYDYDSVLQVLKDLEIKGKGIFPPRSDAILSEDWKEKMTQRDLNILRIHMDGRDVWEYASGYSKRNLVENAMFRFKNNIGPKLRARTSKRQEAEIKLGVHILNQMTRLGMSDSVRIR